MNFVYIKSVRRMTKIVIAGVVVVFLLLIVAWAGRKQLTDFVHPGLLLPLNSDSTNIKGFKNIGGIENIKDLLQAERLSFRSFPVEAFLGQFVPNPKGMSYLEGGFYLKNDDRYIYNPKTRPIRQVDFNKMRVGGEDWLIVGEMVLNKDKTISFLHFGYSDIPWNNTKELNQVLLSFKYKYSYIMPIPQTENCGIYLKYEKKVCQAVDFEKSERLAQEWRQTGIVPGEMELILLAGEDVYY